MFLELYFAQYKLLTFIYEKWDTINRMPHSPKTIKDRNIMTKSHSHS